MIEVVYLAARGCSSAQPSSRAAAAAAAAAVDVDASLRSWGEAERRRARKKLMKTNKIQAQAPMYFTVLTYM